MKKTQLGNTDLMVSEICLGTMTWGEQNSEAEGHAQIDRALESGINFLDTAEMYAVPARAETYGRTETIIGNWLEKTGRRQDIILASKITGPAPHLKYIRPEMENSPNLGRASVIAACEASLKRLKTDYLDLYQIHWPSRPTNYFGRPYYKHEPSAPATPLEETLSAMDELIKAGKVRHVGLSNETPWGVMHSLNLHATKGLPRPQSIQNPYSLLNRSFEVGLAEMAIREKCGLLAYSPLGFGVLSGKYLNGARPEGARLTLFGGQMGRYLSDKCQLATEKYVTLARENGLDPAEMALAFVTNQPFVTSNIIGATTLEQLDSAIRSTEITLSEDILKALDMIDEEITLPAP